MKLHSGASRNTVDDEYRNRSGSEWEKLAVAASKARNVKAWGNAPGGNQRSSQALKARNNGSRLRHAGVHSTDIISRFQRFKISFKASPGALPQAFTFRAFGGANASLLTLPALRNFGFRPRVWN